MSIYRNYLSLFKLNLVLSLQASLSRLPIRKLQASSQEGQHGRPALRSAAPAEEEVCGGTAGGDQGILCQVRDGAGSEAGASTEGMLSDHVKTVSVPTPSLNRLLFQLSFC